MTSLKFQKICRDLSRIGDTVKITTTKESVKFECVGDIAKAETELFPDKEEEKESLTITWNKEMPPQTYALRYLMEFCSATPLSEFVTIQLSDGFPMCVSYPIGINSHIDYYLAPKIDD